MAIQVTETTAASSLAGNAVIADAIETIVREVRDIQQGITGRRPANAELKDTYEGYLKRVAETRGKPALYPYVGSGTGNGARVELADGSVKWDMINGIGVHMFGHGDPEMIGAALRASLGDTVQQGNLQFNLDSIEFSELLLKEAARTSKLKHCFLTNSGCMANESALKVCYQKHAPASRVIAFRDCFMGRSVTMAQIGDSAAGRVGIPLTTLVDYMPFYDESQGAKSTEAAIAQLEQYIQRYPGQHACFVMELVQGEGGFNIAPPEFFVALMNVCKANKIAVWIDEVQTFGRTNEMFHFEQLGLGQYVDVVTLGKMSQVCACLFTEEYAPKPGLLSGTFIGGTVELQVGKRTLERLRDGGYYGKEGKIARLQKAFREHAQKLVDKHPEWFPAVSESHASNGHTSGAKLFGGVGGMMRLTPFGGDKTKVMRLLHVMFAEGLIAFYCGHGPYHVRFLPPVGVMQPGQFEDVFRVVE
ncbi:MAG TPA: aminotransferase class III-fold pyridoxal phosphate-dependent enzyme, partial [Phycisphaerales bacterium]|nr:aminotransferase class III-fold pyridoxal phosphate-dependent enzyme [Phycisphaerales bacterium]